MAYKGSPRPYLIALVAAVILNLGLRLRILEHVLRAHQSAPWLIGVIQRGLLLVFAALLVAFWWLLLVRVLPEFRRGLAPSRWQLASLVWLASGMAATNLLSENIAIYRLNLSSYTLLMDALMLYLGISLIFLFWYWFIDKPPRRQGILWEQSGPAALTTPYGIVFPEETLERDVLLTDRWQPEFMDYAYFTILCSNCFGPPEGHLLVGRQIKVLHSLHSLAMITVFIVILARAINTLN
ncbi:hypothetical protein [Synechococcus sp. CBW1108]|uniref:hypothetical protein n=1 Tax=Synechococcus sp. CBW1108 TaxID=1353147 RepID=UPI0018CD7227|nr:hypothetical protein [Synechococcus sp. CBW1108]QPN70928.1 hypothetical protein H8F27_04700 [Synechococcus sp. CBW1108]